MFWLVRTLDVMSALDASSMSKVSHRLGFDVCPLVHWSRFISFTSTSRYKQHLSCFRLPIILLINCCWNWKNVASSRPLFIFSCKRERPAALFSDVVTVTMWFLLSCLAVSIILFLLLPDLFLVAQELVWLITQHLVYSTVDVIVHYTY